MEIITTHLNADFDALASMIAAKKLYPNAILVFPGSQERNLRDFFIESTIYLFEFERVKKVDINKVTRLILTDTRQKKRIGKFADLIGKKGVEIHIYDHHPPSDDDIKGDFELIRETGANITNMVELLKEKKIKINPEEATIMMLGIYEDTGSLTFSSVTEADFHAAAYLLSQGANLNVVSDMIVKELSAEQIFLLNDLIQSAEKYNIEGVDVVITTASYEKYVGDLAVLIHKLKDMENLDVLLALVRMEDRVYFIGRSRIQEVNVADIAYAFGGGGHPTAASATVKDLTLAQAKDKLIAILKEVIKPKRIARDLMFFPVKSIDAKSPIKEAEEILTRYNINALPVMEKGKLVGIISRQIVEKASFHGLSHRPVKEYMTIEFYTVTPDATLAEVHEYIIGNNQRFLPVLEDGKLVGAITRTDLLRVLQDEMGKISRIPEKIDYSRMLAQKKIITKLMEERLPSNIIMLLKEMGKVGDDMGYHLYAVGGFVRDLMLRYENLDIDVVVEGDAIKFAERFSRMHGYKVINHKKMGTATIKLPDGFKVDVATARIEYYASPGAIPTVEHGSLKLDLFRRDFTINALALALNPKNFGEVIDFFGAQKDIKERVIRVIHNLSFVEDPSRIFRAIRFEQRYQFQLGKHTLNLIRSTIKTGFLSSIGAHRIFLELLLIFKEKDPVAILRRLNSLGVLKAIDPKLELSESRLSLVSKVQKVLSWFDLLFLDEKVTRWIVYIYSIIDHLNFKEASLLLERFSISEKKKKEILKSREELIRILNEIYKRNISNGELTRSEIYNFLKDLRTEAILFMMAKTDQTAIQRYISIYITELRKEKVIIGGDDLKEMGFTPGPMFKKILNELLMAHLENKVSTKEE
ncbi:MAG: polya polymerase, partial [Spirochaetes bacterium]